MDSAYATNWKVALDVAQLGLSLFMGVFFAGLSYASWLMRGRSSTYYISQLFALGFIALAVIFLAVKVVVTIFTF